MSTKGIDMVLPSDYDKLVVARQRELAHIDDELSAICARCSQLYALMAIQELREWIAQQRACHAVAEAARQ
jgi:MinD superfamily P-loop ATPase